MLPKNQKFSMHMGYVRVFIRGIYRDRGRGCVQQRLEKREGYLKLLIVKTKEHNMRLEITGSIAE